MSLELYHKNATSRGHGSLISELWCTPQGCYLSVNNRKHQVTYKSLSFIYERLLWKQWSQMQHLTHMIQTLRSQILTSPSWLVASTWRFTLFHLTCEAPTKITNKNKILIIFRAVINGHNPWDLLRYGWIFTCYSSLKLNDSPEYLETTQKYVYLSLCIKLYWESEQYYYNYRNLKIVMSNKSHCWHQ